ncbi:MAG: 4-hydroxy-3-methylbut-2-enyl diphosphate reductase [Pseudomonadota bacterium]|nr:4-hydroxy-3-methylbut-2-enyl diphosphate reductase [Pseudomonadota bacterium]
MSNSTQRSRFGALPEAAAGAALLLAKPRGFCAGVVRAVQVVELALEAHGAPVYVLHEIIHNHRVLAELAERGAVFVDVLDEVPGGSCVIFSAHGVAGSVEREARQRGLQVIDATCPLVAKVHIEVMRHARAGRDLIVVGHAGHPEVAGTLGRFDTSCGGSAHLVESLAGVQALLVRDPERVAVVTQTTLSVDDTRRILIALRERYPGIIESRRDDICYATQSRQNGVRNLLPLVDLIIVVGARNSSNSNRLREVAQSGGCEAHLVQDASEIDVRWLRPGIAIGITAGASTPAVLVDEVVERLQGLGAGVVTEMEGEDESVSFPLPVSLQRKTALREARTTSGDEPES